MRAIKGLVIKHQQACGAGRVNNKIDIAIMADCEYRLNEKFREELDEINQADGYVIVTYNEDGNRIEQCELYKFPPHLLEVLKQEIRTFSQLPVNSFMKPLVNFAAVV